MPNPRYNPMPQGRFAQGNPVMAEDISDSPVFSAVAQEIAHDREVQSMRYFFIYSVTDTITGQQTLPYQLTTEQGSDFDSFGLTGSAFSYDAVNATTFPSPNALGSTAWACRGLSVKITDANAGRDISSGYVPFELFATPGYGIGFSRPFPFRYHFRRNSKIVFDIRNRDGALRTHSFSIAIIGYKSMTP